MSAHEPSDKQGGVTRVVGITATRPVWALVIGLSTVLWGFATVFFQHLTNTQEVIQQHLQTLDEEMNLRTARLVRIETKLESIERFEVETSAWEKRMEDKLDHYMSGRPEKRVEASIITNTQTR